MGQVFTNNYNYLYYEEIRSPPQSKIFDKYSYGSLLAPAGYLWHNISQVIKPGYISVINDDGRQVFSFALQGYQGILLPPPVPGWLDWPGWLQRKVRVMQHL